MSSFEERVSTLMGLIVLDNPACLEVLPTEHIHESAAVYSIIGRLMDGDIETAFRIYNFNGDGVQGVICNHLLFITNHGFAKYKQKLNRFFR